MACRSLFLNKAIQVERKGLECWLLSLRLCWERPLIWQDLVLFPGAEGGWCMHAGKFSHECHIASRLAQFTSCWCQKYCCICQAGTFGLSELQSCIVNSFLLWKISIWWTYFLIEEHITFPSICCSPPCSCTFQALFSILCIRVWQRRKNLQGRGWSQTAGKESACLYGGVYVCVFLACTVYCNQQ